MHPVVVLRNNKNTMLRSLDQRHTLLHRIHRDFQVLVQVVVVPLMTVEVVDNIVVVVHSLFKVFFVYIIYIVYRESIYRIIKIEL